MYTDPYTDEPIEFDEPLYILLVLRDWTNQVVGRVTDVPQSGIEWASEHLLFNAWDHADGPQTWTVVAVPADWENREYCHTYSMVEHSIYDSARFHPDWGEPWFMRDLNHQVAAEVNQWLTVEHTHWRCADGSHGKRTTRRSKTSRMMRYARFVARHIAQPDGAPTPIGAPVGYADAPDYDILTSDDMVPWESDVVGELGSGPGVAA